MNRRPAILLLIGAAALVSSAPVSAQAFTPPAGVGAVTVAWQYVDNTGHRFSDGFLISRGESVTASTLLEVDYGVSDRLSLSVGIPYVFAKYTGALPPPSRLPGDACACWHSGFQDFAISARYRFGNELWAVTPSVRFLIPSHDYPYRGEAVVGRNLQETQAGISSAVRLPGVLRKMTLESGYTYAFVEKPLPDISINRSDASFSAGYSLGERFFVRAGANWVGTNGGLRIGSPSGKPFFPPGELNTPERFAQRDRLLRVQYWQAGAGLAYNIGPVDIFASYSKYIWGRNAHDGQVYTLGTTWYFNSPLHLR